LRLNQSIVTYAGEGSLDLFFDWGLSLRDRLYFGNFVVDELIKQKFDPVLIQTSGVIGDPLNTLFVGLLNNGGPVLDLLAPLLQGLHNLIKDFIGTSPLLRKALLLQKLKLNVVDGDLSDGLLEMEVVFAVEPWVLLPLFVQLLPNLDRNQLTHLKVDLSYLRLSQHILSLNRIKTTARGTVKSG